MLVTDGEAIIQSLAIIDWLDRAHPEPRLIPDDPMPRAVALAQAHVVACDIHPLNNLRVLKYLKKDLELNEQTRDRWRSEEHTSELQSLMRTSYADFCLTQKKSPHILPP